MNEFKIKNGYLSEGNSQVTGSLNVSGGITGSLFGTASFALAVAGGGAAFPYTGSAIISGSLTVTGSLNSTGGITGSLQGTASFALTSPLGNRITQIPTTSFNQYQAASGAGNTMLFSASVFSAVGQIIDVDFLARNNAGVTTIIRVYVNSTATLSGATQIGNFSFGPTTDLMVRYTHRFVVLSSGPAGTIDLVGCDGIGYYTDIFNAGDLYFSSYQIGTASPFAITKPFILVALNQSGSLIAASINY